MESNQAIVEDENGLQYLQLSFEGKDFFVHVNKEEAEKIFNDAMYADVYARMLVEKLHLKNNPGFAQENALVTADVHTENNIGNEKSGILQYFSIEPDTPEKAKCDICNTVLTRRGGEKSNLMKHLRTKHPTVVIEPEKFSVLAGKKRNGIWQHFSILRDFPNKARCDICNNILSRKGRNTANLRKHLSRTHPTVVVESVYPTLPPSSKTGRKRSLLWLYFSSVENSPGNAQCGICKTILSYKGGGTSNLLKHLVCRHPTVVSQESNGKKQVIPSEIIPAESSLALVSSTSQFDESESSGPFNISGRKRSLLWTYFSSIGDSPGMAQCGVCQKVLSFKGGGTSNLMKHLRKKHPSVDFQEDPGKRQSLFVNESERTSINTEISFTVTPTAISSKQAKLPSLTSNPVQVKLQNRVNDLLLNMIVKDLQPLSIIEDQGFKELITGIEPKYQPPSLDVLSKTLLLQRYNCIVQDLKDMLTKAEYITLAMDCWTSIASKRYIAVTANFITDSWETFSGLLECFKREERHTAENLGDELKRVVADWGIADKIYTIITDTSADSAAAVRLTGWKHLLCFAHTLNLIVESGLEIIKTVQSKVKAIVEYFQRNAMAARKLASVQLELRHEMVPLKLKNDITAHWNSTYFMLQRICEIQESVETALNMLQNPVEDLSAEEWTISKELCKILKPFEQITVQISSEKHVPASKVIVIIRGLTTALNRIRPALSKEVSLKLVDELLESLATRFHEVEHHNILSIASYLDPRFKEKSFLDNVALTKAKDCVTSDIVELLESQSTNNIVECIYGHENMLQELAIATTDKVNSAVMEVSASHGGNGINVGCFPEHDDLIWQEFDRVSSSSSASATPLSTAIIKLRQYSEEPIISRKENPLEWWKTRELVYPRLSKLAKKHLGVVATAVPCQKLFSKTGQILFERRSRLKASYVHKLMFLHFNHKLLRK